VVDEEKDIELCEGEIFIVPKNVEHKPVAVEEVPSPYGEDTRHT